MVTAVLPLGLTAFPTTRFLHGFPCLDGVVSEHPTNHRLSRVRHCFLSHSPDAHQIHQSCAASFTRRAVMLKKSRGQHPKQFHPHAMLMKSAFVYALSLTLGIAAVTHAKTLLIEQAPQQSIEDQELVYRTGLPSRRHRMRPKFSCVAEQWVRRTV